MTESFKDCYDKLIALFPPKSKKQAEIHREDLWEELKFNGPIINQVFKRVRQEWKGVSLPTIQFFIEQKRETLYGEKEKVLWHKAESNGDPHPDCKCEGCKVYNRAIENKCLNLKCNNERTVGDEFCDDCHVIARSYYCLCDLCENHRKSLLEVEKAEVEDDLPF